MNKLRLGIFPNMKKENVKNSLPKVLDLCDKAEICLLYTSDAADE